MKCPHCGSEGEYKICRNCGRPVPEDTGPEDEDAAEPVKKGESVREVAARLRRWAKNPESEPEIDAYFRKQARKSAKSGAKPKPPGCLLPVLTVVLIVVILLFA
ncbi:MAG: hypothetical protein H0Z39_08640 [Peptococcaceae bacterium]|nr:hypothetical protein [Peptococcaceae bacterium]